MPCIEERLPRVVGHAVNATLSLLLWRAIALASLGLVHWASVLGR